MEGLHFPISFSVRESWEHVSQRVVSGCGVYRWIRGAGDARALVPATLTKGLLCCKWWGCRMMEPPLGHWVTATDGSCLESFLNTQQALCEQMYELNR